jgi:hypothetical protein
MLLPLELVEFVVEVSQSKAALIGSSSLADEVMLAFVDDGGTMDAVLLLDGFCGAGNRSVDGDINSSSSRSLKSSEMSGIYMVGVLMAFSVNEFVAACVVVDELILRGSRPSCSRVGSES